MSRGAPGRAQLLAGLAVFFLLLAILTRASVTSSREPSAATKAAELAGGEPAQDNGPADSEATGGTDVSTDASTDESTDETSSTLEFPESDTVPPTSDQVGGEVVGTPAVDGALDKVLVVGGSSLAGLNWNPTTKQALQGAEYTLDLEPCRRLFRPSCSALRAAPPTTAYEVVEAQGAGHGTMILFGGYNDSGHRFEEGFKKVVEIAREKGIKRIIWASYRLAEPIARPADPLTGKNYRMNNFILQDLLATGDYPEIVLADWNKYAQGSDFWFADTVHFTGYGAWAAADYLSRKLAFLDGRACPQPRRPNEPVQNPCPDPDLKPPDVDFQSVYRLKPGRLVCYDATNPVHIACVPRAELPDDLANRLVLESLKYGDEGPSVRALQSKLRQLNIYKHDVNGTFDKDTLEAVMEYQIAQGLDVTGNVGPTTRESLGFGCGDVRRNKDGTCPKDDGDIVFPWTPEREARGAYVWVLQHRLVELGYVNDAQDYFGSRTEAALKQFQQKKKLPVTGAADERTLKALGFEVP